MNSSHSFTRNLISQRPLVIAAALLVSSPAAWCAGAGGGPVGAAQPAAASKASGIKKELAPPPTDEQAFAALVKQDQDAKLPASEIIASSKAFLKANPQIGTNLGIDIYRKIVALQQQTKDSVAVHQSYYALIARYRETPEALPVVLEHARLFLTEGRAGEAVRSMQPFLGRIAGTETVRYPGSLLYAQALQADAQWPRMSQFLETTLAQQPALLAESSGTLIQMLTDALMRQQRNGDALRWAKLRFVTCDFDNAAVTGASALLSRTWLARDLSLERAQAFTVALQDPAKSNPLFQVPLPAAFVATKAAIALRVKTNKLAPHDHITLLLAAGLNTAALAEARNLLVDDKTAVAGVNELCRVLKARTLNVRDANAFVAYVKTGTGPNPLSEAPVAPAPSLKPSANPAQPSALAGATATQPKVPVASPSPAPEQSVRPSKPSSFGVPARSIS